MEQHEQLRPQSDWACVHCSTIGRSHLEEGTVCQDKTFTLCENGVTAFALADGAGSARLSHYGAQTVTETVCRLLCRQFNAYYDTPTPAQVKSQIHQTLLAALEQTAAHHGCGLKDLASTLLAVAICGDRYLLMHIGDGVIGYVKDDQLKVASVPSNGEFANTTTFVTSGDAVQDMRIRKGESPQIQGFVLMSDGCEASLYHKQHRQLAPVLQRLVCRLSVTSAAYLTPKIQESLDLVVSKKTRDDCSLVLAARMENYARLSEDEQNDYFDIDQERLKPRVAQRRRERFVALLDILEQERSGQELAGFLNLKNQQYAIKHWVQPLIELGYVEVLDSGMFRRTVGTPAGEAALPVDMETKEETDHG